MTDTPEFIPGVDDMLVDKDWLLARLGERHGAKAELADFMGLDRTALSKMLSGKRVVSQRDALLVRKFFGEADVIGAAGSTDLPNDVRDVIKLIVSSYESSSVRMNVSNDEALVLQEALSTFERLFGPERPDEARLALRLRKQIESEFERLKR